MCAGTLIGSGSGRRGVACFSVRVAGVRCRRFEFPVRAEQMALVPDQGVVEELASAGLYPAFRERVRSGYLDAGGDDLQAGVGQQCVEGGGELRVSVSDQELGSVVRVLQVHEEIAAGLHDPRLGGVGCCAQDPDAPRGVLDDGEDVQARPGQGAGLEEIAGEQCGCLVAEEVGSGRALPFRCGWDAVLAEDLPDGRSGDLDAEGRELAVDSAIPSRAVLAGQAQDEGANRADGGRAPATLARRSQHGVA